MLIFFLPVLYHLELNACGATVIDVTRTPIISLKVRQGATSIKLVSIPESTESVYIATADKMIHTDVAKSNLDYLYLPNC